MMKLLKSMLICGAVSLTNFAAVAQSRPVVCVPSGQGFGPLQVSSLAGCPFSAVVEIVRTRKLGDGSQVQTKSRALSYRDSVGRVGYQSFAITENDQDRPETPNMILIADTFARFEYVIFPDRTTAWRYAMKIPAASWLGGEQPQDPSPQPSGSQATPDAGVKISVENLGSRQMEGLLAEGTRTTKTIPAGVDGSDKEVTVIIEWWISPELGITLLKKVSDPRSQDREERVTKLWRSEPDAAWFRVPEGYAIVNQ